MKVRKLAVALALAGGLGSSVAHALGLGEIELQSFLNEPLDAEIDLRKSTGVSPDEVFVNIASEADYNRVGISRNYFLTKLRFNVTTAPDGNLVVNVSSSEPLREPYLNFLLEVTWPSGRLMREYSLLVDPPVYAEESGERQVVAPAASTATRTTASPSRPAATRSSAPASAAGDTAYSRTTFGPTGQSDTLWGIAIKVRPDSSLSPQQVMLAIQDLNPDAFIDGNINKLKRGQVLRIPTAEQIRSRTPAQAVREVVAQNEALSAPRREVDATASAESVQPQAPAAAPGTAPAPDELKLLVSEDSGSRASEDGGSAAGDGRTGGTADAGSAVAMEELDKVRRENEDLSGRVEDLQSQVETLQRLLELKNSQLAEIQNLNADGADGALQPAPVTGTGEVTADSGAEAGTAELQSAESADAAVAGADGSDVGDDAGDPEVGAAEAGAPEEGADATDSRDAAEGLSTDAAAGAGTDEMASDEAAGGVADDAFGGTAEPASEAAPEPQPLQQSAQPAPTEPAPVAASQPKADKGFPGNFIDAITNNFLYQVALGGGLVLLLLILLLLARRNASREKAFYDELNAEAGDEKDSFDLPVGAQGGAVEAEVDALAEADALIGQGRYEQAGQSLEAAISREPSRSDLRLKLLTVYADTQDRSAFDKQFRELEAMEDEQVMAEAVALRSRLDEAEDIPSIDDLESQLRSGSFGNDSGTDESSLHPTDETVAEEYAARPEDNELAADFDFESGNEAFDLDEDELAKAAGAETGTEAESFDFDLSDLDVDAGSDVIPDNEAKKAEQDDFSLDFEIPEAVEEQDDLTVDFDLGESAGSEETSSLDLDRDSADLTGKSDSDLDNDFSSLELDDLDTDTATDLGGLATDSESAEPLADKDTGMLDESFLDELDAELDKVGAEDGFEDDLDDGGLEELELDVSDEDLALMEEVSEGGSDLGALDDDLDLENSLADDGSLLSDEVPVAEDVEDDIPLTSPEAGVQAEETARSAGSVEFDEADIGEDDDFDFLSGTDEAATKLDLARAYIEMGDNDGARDILEEVALEGSDSQKLEAQDLLKKMS